MSLLCLSYSHQHTPIKFRERVYFDNDSVATACARFRCGEGLPSPLIEFAVLSTCNRTEFYAFTSLDPTGDSGSFFAQPGNQACDQILQFISEARGVPVDELGELGHWMCGPEVARHLSRVACGLESLVLGEPQILGQVGDALRLGLIMNSAGPVLTQLFRTAIAAGKRARSETQIGCHSSNISTLAVTEATRHLESLADKTVVILGAGEMAELAMKQLHQQGARDFRVVNRTIAKAQELAQLVGGESCVFEQIGQLLPQADLLITSTGAPHVLITHEMIEFAMQNRSYQPMLIVDIAVPRDVESEVDEIPQVIRRDIDDLQIAAGHSVQLRQQQVPQVQKIIDVEMDRFVQWMRGVGCEQIINALRQKADGIRNRELTRLAQLLPELDADSWQIVQRFANALVNKLLHDPTRQLRQLDGSREAIDHGEAIRQLFRLQPTIDSSDNLAPFAPTYGRHPDGSVEGVAASGEAPR